MDVDQPVFAQVRRAFTEEDKQHFKAEGRCFRCDKQGHMARECPERKQQAFILQKSKTTFRKKQFGNHPPKRKFGNHPSPLAYQRRQSFRSNYVRPQARVASIQEVDDSPDEEEQEEYKEDKTGCTLHCRSNCQVHRERTRTLAPRNAQQRDKFLEVPQQSAMLRTLFPQAVFMPKERSIQAKVHIQSRTLHQPMLALLDSGATDNFISPDVVEHFKVPTCILPAPRTIRNVDGTRNSIGSVTKTAQMWISYNNQTHLHNFYVVELGADDMLLGMPFFATTNPKINWTAGTFHGKVTASITDSHKWSYNRDQSVI